MPNLPSDSTQSTHESSPRREDLEFIGGGVYVVDTKRRVKFPTDWTSSTPDQVELVLSLIPSGKDGKRSIWGMTRRYLRDISGRIKEQEREGKLSREQADALRHMFIINAKPLRPDVNGRICLPEDFVKKAGIQREVQLCGNLEWFEVWDRSAYVEKTPSEEAQKNALDQFFAGNEPK